MQQVTQGAWNLCNDYRYSSGSRCMKNCCELLVEAEDVTKAMKEEVSQRS